MKKIIFSIISIVAMGIMANAQVTLTPGSFTAEDSVTITVDVTGNRSGQMENQSEAYIWIFAFKTDDPNAAATNGIFNGDWTNSTVMAKMTKLGPNKWQWGFKSGTSLFGLTPADLTHGFGFLIKAKDGSKQTDNYQVFKFDPLVFTPSKLRVFPSKAGKEDVVTLNYERTLGSSTDEQRMIPTSVTITMYDDNTPMAAVGSPITLNVKKTADNIWSASFIPTASFTAGAGHKLKKFTYHFNGTILGATGAVQTTVSTDATFDFTEMK